MFINLLSHIFILFCERPVKTKTSLKTAKDQSFDNIGQWWTGLGLGPSKNGQKTGLDQTFKHY